MATSLSKKSTPIQPTTTFPKSYNVTKLNLSGKDNEEKIKVIGNLSLYRNLVLLNLSENKIEKIENVESLVNLKHLNLAGNRIVRLDGLEQCSKLITLNVNRNLIASIPIWIAKKLNQLKTLHLADNCIQELSQITRLQGLASLATFSFEHNPAIDRLSTTVSESQSDESENLHNLYRLFVLHQLPKLVLLDGQEVTSNEVQQANRRFGRVDGRKMLRDMSRSSSYSNSVQERPRRDSGLARTDPSSKAQENHSFQNDEADRIEKLEQELRLKDNLLRTRSDELARACLKHFELEQELAFHKIDTKMAAFLLGPRPKLDSDSIQGIDSTGDQPYIGRCRSRIFSTPFRSPRFHSHEQLSIRPSQSVDHLSVGPSFHNPLATSLKFGSMNLVQDFTQPAYQSRPKLLQSAVTKSQDCPIGQPATQRNLGLQSPDSLPSSLSPGIDRHDEESFQSRPTNATHPPSSGLDYRDLEDKISLYGEHEAGCSQRGLANTNQIAHDRLIDENQSYEYDSDTPTLGQRQLNQSNPTPAELVNGAAFPEPSHATNDTRVTALTGPYQPNSPPPMQQHSAASSRPSSRTAGTGRSAEKPMEPFVQQDLIKSDGSSSHTGALDSDGLRHPRKDPRKFNGIITENGLRKPRSLQNPENSGATALCEAWHSQCFRNSIDLGDPRGQFGQIKNSNNSSMGLNEYGVLAAPRDQIEFHAPPSHRRQSSTQLKRSPSMSDGFQDSDNDSDPVTRKIDSGQARRKSDGRRSATGDRAGNDITEQAKQLLKLLIKSRRASNTDRSEECYSAINGHCSSREKNMEATTSRQLPRPGDAHSGVDTWTTVTKPSPNEFDQDELLGSPEEVPTRPIHKCSRPRRLLPNTSAPEQPDGFGHSRIYTPHLEKRSLPFRPSRHLPRGRSLDARFSVSNCNHVWDDESDEAEEEPSTETAALANLTEELIRLRRGMKKARKVNSNRLEMALKHIAALEAELQRQQCLAHDMRNSQEREAERACWEKRLAATLAELKKCQNSIMEMRERMDGLEAIRQKSNQSEQQQTELEKTRKVLDAQKEEISRLNQLLNRLLGIGPDHVSSDDLAQIQAGLVQLNRNMQPELGQTSGPVRRAQSWLSGLAPGLDGQAPGSMFKTTSGHLLCNVPEHHQLEDHVDDLEHRLDDLKEEQKENQKRLIQAAKTKKKLQKRLEDQTAEIDRFNADASMKHDELLSIRAELKRLSDTKQDEQKHNQERLTTLASDLAQIENAVSQRRDEVSKLDARLKEAETELKRCQTLTQELNTQRDIILNDHRRSKLELDTVQSQLNDVKEQLRQKNQDLKELQIQIEEATTRKRQLQDVLHESGQTIKEREAELQKLTKNIQEAETKFHRVETSLSDGERRLEFQRRTLADEESNLRNKQTEAARLKEKIDEHRAHLEHLTKELCDQKTSFERLQSEKKRELDEAESKLKAKQAELNQIEASLHGNPIQTARIGSSYNGEGDSDLDPVNEGRKQLKAQVDKYQRRLKDLKRQESEIQEAITAGKRELSKIRREVERESSRSADLKRQRITSENEQKQLLSQLQQKRSELDDVEQRLSSTQSALESQETSLAEQRRKQHELDEDLSRMNHVTQLNREAQRTAEEARETSQSLLHTALEQLDRTSRDACAMDKKLRDRREKLNLVDQEVSNKMVRLEELNSQIKRAEAQLSKLGINDLDQGTTKSADSNSEVARLKQSLAQSQHELKQLKRRSTRDLTELERIAEEQCSRAGDLSEQLMLVKRQYAQLKSQVSTYGLLMDEVITIASQTELDEHGKRLEAALSAARAELEQSARSCHHNYHSSEQNWDVLRTGSAPDVGYLHEPQQLHVTGSLNQLDQPDGSNLYPPKPALDPSSPMCMQTVNHGIEAYESTSRTGMTTVTSGLGSSLLPMNTGSTLDASPIGENNWKRQLANCVAEQKERVRVTKEKEDNRSQTTSQQRPNTERSDRNVRKSRPVAKPKKSAR